MRAVGGESGREGDICPGRWGECEGRSEGRGAVKELHRAGWRGGRVVGKEKSIQVDLLAGDCGCWGAQQFQLGVAFGDGDRHAAADARVVIGRDSTVAAVCGGNDVLADPERGSRGLAVDILSDAAGLGSERDSTKHVAIV